MRSRAHVDEGDRLDILQEGDMVVLTNITNSEVAGRRLVVGPSPVVNVTFNTIEAWDVDNDGKLNFEEFFNGLSKETIEKHMTMTFKGPERIY